MASTIKSDNGVSSGVTGIVQTADSTGQLALQTTTSGGTATTAITIDNSQNVGVGVTSPLGRIGVKGSGTYASAYNSNEFQIFDPSGLNNANYGFYINQTYAGNTSAGAVFTIGVGNSNNHLYSIAFATNNTEAARIDTSGNFLIGETSTGYQSANGCYYSPSNGYWINNHLTGTSSGVRYQGFGYGIAEVGSITQSGTTAVLYNTTSDYRLKNNPVPVTGAKDFVMALQPKTWDWWDGSGKGVGFIAHEFMEVAKYSGHGEKDAIDADGKPVYQSIQPSSSEVMANLVAYIQELSAEVTALKAKIGV